MRAYVCARARVCLYVCARARARARARAYTRGEGWGGSEEEGCLPELHPDRWDRGTRDPVPLAVCAGG